MVPSHNADLLDAAGRTAFMLFDIGERFGRNENA